MNGTGASDRHDEGLEYCPWVEIYNQDEIDMQRLDVSFTGENCGKMSFVIFCMVTSRII